MNTSKYLLIVTVAIFANNLSANEVSLEQKLAEIKFEKLQAEVMIKRMHKIGRMDQDEAQGARRAIASVKEEDIEQMRSEALERLNARNSFANQ